MNAASVAIALCLVISSDPYDPIHTSHNAAVTIKYTVRTLILRIHTHADCRVFEGDICISDKQWKYLNRRVNSDPAPLGSKSDSHAPRRGQRAVVKVELLKWIDGVVPYVLADDLSKFNPLIVIISLINGLVY